MGAVTTLYRSTQLFSDSVRLSLLQFSNFLFKSFHCVTQSEIYLFLFILDGKICVMGEERTRTLLTNQE